jgi:hypothetical protein
MRRLFAIPAVLAALLAVGAGQASAGNHSGPEALAKGTGALTTAPVSSVPIIGCTQVFFGICFPGQVGSTNTTTTTSENFDFDAKAGPQTLTPIDPTNGPYGHMHLVYTQTVSVDTVQTGPCVPFPGFPCPTPSHTTLPSQSADITAEVTCLNVANNTAAIGGHVIKFSGTATPMSGLLFNAVDNTIARQQTAPDLFDGTLVANAPQVCPAPSGGHPITSGDIYVQQS